jgi:colicin import membrane protein
VAKPDIAQLEKPKPKPKPKPAAKPEPKRDKAFERQLQAQLAAEQKTVIAAEAQRQERELQALIAKQQKAARDRALAAWTERITAKIKSRIPVPVAEAVQGNPEAVFAVSLLPTAEVFNVRMTRSSGNKAYDEAVERAIIGASPLPRPDDPGVFQRQLELRFRPKDKPAS